MKTTISDLSDLALRCRQSSDPREAEQLYRQILQLGGALVGQGHFDEAAECFRQAVGIRPEDALAHYNLGNVHKDQGRLTEAAQCYRQALRVNPQNASALNNLGIALAGQEQFAEAAECYREVLRLDPRHANALNNLGNVLSKQGRKEEAVRILQEALRLEPNRPDFLYNLGAGFQEHGDLDQAVLSYRQALRQKPNYPDASNNLAKALKEQGLLEEAIAQFRETLQLQPGHAYAIYNLSELAATGHFRFPAEEIESIKARMHSGQGSDLERSLLGFTLGTVLDKEGSFDEAFGYYQEANQARRRLLEKRRLDFDAAKHQAFVERLMETYNQAYFQQVHGWGLDTELPVFIIGMPRSGSTLVEQILASHPQVLGGGEMGELPKLNGTWAAKIAADPYTVPVMTNITAARELADDYAKHLAKLGPGASRVTNKTLENYLHLGLVATLFPKARIIHCRREPLDVCLSCYFQNFQDMPFSCSLEDIGIYYRTYERLMTHWRQVLPMPIHELCYEDLIGNQETVTRDLLAFCGLEFDERCLNFFNTRRVVRTASAIQVRKPLSARSVGRWKNYRNHLAPLFAALGLEMGRLPT